MKNLLFLCILFFTGSLHAQQIKFYPSDYIRFLGANNDTLYNAFTGGLANPMFSNIDLNNDGRLDLFIFDKLDNRPLTFLNIKTKDSVKLVYTPQYEAAFPKMNAWAFLKDYNNDGKPDLFTYGSSIGEGGSMSLYKNVSSGQNLAFELYIPVVKTETSQDISRIGANEVEIPAFVDVDMDGDMDILAFSTSYTNYVWYYKNKQELYPGKDTLVFWLDNMCFGRFREVADGSIILNLTPKEYQDFLIKREKKHAGSSLMAFDPDGDGDVDLLISDPERPKINYLQNARKKGGQTNWNKDSMDFTTTAYPIHKAIDLMGMPLAASVDITGDGFNDLLVSPMDQFSKRKNFVWMYHNTSKLPVQQFKFIKSSFLEDNMVELGVFTKPAFFDYNGDGLPDLLVGVKGELDNTNTDHLLLYLNQGTAQKAIFKLHDDDFIGIGRMNIAGTAEAGLLSPTFADINGDGKTDLFLGNDLGTVLYFENTGTTGNAVYSWTGQNLQIKVGNSTEDLDAGNNSHPTFVDMNNDGKLDILVGNSLNQIAYYKNISTNSTPLFELVNDAFATINGDSQLVPTAADLDGDGKTDLLIGSATGKIFMFPHISDTSKMLSPQSNIFYNYQSKNFGLNNSGKNTAIAVSKLDNDDKPDLLIGNLRGGFYFMGSKDNGQKMPVSVFENNRKIADKTQLNVSLYPNPAQENVTVAFQNLQAQKITMILTDVSGKQIWSNDFFTDSNAKKTIQLPELSNGLYFVRLQGEKSNVSCNKKLFISK